MPGWRLAKRRQAFFSSGGLDEGVGHGPKGRYRKDTREHRGRAVESGNVDERAANRPASARGPAQPEGPMSFARRAARTLRAAFEASRDCRCSRLITRL